MKVGMNLMSALQAHCQLWRSGEQVSSPNWFEWVRATLDTGTATNTCPLNFGPEGAGDGRLAQTLRETADSTERQVVGAFLMVWLGNFKATTKVASLHVKNIMTSMWI